MVGIATVFALGGCARAEHSPPVLSLADAPPLEAPPPDVVANGAAGVPFSFSRGNYVADGGIDQQAGDYPVVDAPISFTFEEPIRYVTAYVSAVGRDDLAVSLTGVDADGVVIGEDIGIASVPRGPWRWLVIDVAYEDEAWGSAAFVWALPPP